MATLTRIFFVVLALVLSSLYAQETYIIPHFTIGGGWSTRVILPGTGTTDSAVVVMRDATGREVMRTRLMDDYAIGKTFSSDGPLVTGTIEVSYERSVPYPPYWTPISVGANSSIHAVFSYNRDGQTQEAAARHNIPSNRKNFIQDPDEGHRHGVAIVNTEAFPITLRIQTGRFERNCLQVVTKTIKPKGQVIFTLEDAIPSLTTEACSKSSLVSISGDYGFADAKFSAVAFRFNTSGLFTAIPME